jgi:hypothetical protein
MAKAADPPSTSTPPSPQPRDREGHAESAAHLVCAYSPRWLSGPTPGFEGLVATWSPTEDHESDRARHH